MSARLSKEIPPLRLVMWLGAIVTVPLLAIAIASFAGRVLIQRLLFDIDPGVNGELRAALTTPGIDVAVRAIGRGAIIADSRSALVMSAGDVQHATVRRLVGGAEVWVTIAPKSRQRVRGALTLGDGRGTFVNGHTIQQFGRTSLDGPELLLVTKISPRVADELAVRLNAEVDSRPRAARIQPDSQTRDAKAAER